MRGPANRDAVQKVGRGVSGIPDLAFAIVLPATADQFWVLDTICYSYDGTPVDTATISVAFGNTGKWKLDIGGTVSHTFRFPRGLANESVVNESVLISLGAGGPGVTGKLNITYR